MTREELIKRKLLITQFVLYGYINSPTVVGATPLSPNVNGTGLPSSFILGVPYVHNPSFDSFGPMTNTQPIDVSSRSVSGTYFYSGMEYWNQCLDLYMRFR